ncbi:MAG: CRTAC1 family protein, partial [Planctomycetes bacterium]|nr:CRTAC1 family protein [Planctomycetota bacterium]
GWLDLFVTDFEEQKPILFHNLGQGQFEDATLRSGAGSGAVAEVKWGVGFVDFDNDTFCDVFIGCGHLGEDFNPSASRMSSYRAPPVILRNRGDGTFVDASNTSGAGANRAMAARGVACDDLDNDGRVDVVVLNSRGRPVVLRNESSPGNHWLQVRLRGVGANRHAVGARVKITAGGKELAAEVHSGRGYQSHFGSRLTFGLGASSRVERLEIHWSAGGRDVWRGFDSNQEVIVVEGRSPK